MQAQLNSQLFGSVPEDIGCFFTDGKINGAEVVEKFGYKKKEVAAATGINIQSIRYDKKMPTDLEKRLYEWATAFNLVANFFKDVDKAVIWFRTTNSLLGEMTPRDMIRVGRFKKLLKFIRNAVE